MLTRENYFFNQEFISGGLIIYNTFTLGHKLWPLKKLPILGYLWKRAFYSGCQKYFYYPTSSAFLAIFSGSRKKTDATFSNQF